MLSCVVDEIVGDDGVKMMGAVKFSGVEVEDVSLLIVKHYIHYWLTFQQHLLKVAALLHQ
jgi:hypothetical protein